MFASIARSRVRRRGVVLVVILGMLGLLALIGVTFATFSNQAQINARNFAQAQTFPDATEMMDYALSQLILDTANPQSVIRGHSLARDMYGNDAANNGALLNGLPDGSGPITIQSGALAPSYVATGPFTGLIKLVTNIPNNNNSTFFYGYDFRRWVIRTSPLPQASVNFSVYYGARSFEVLADDANDSSGFRVFYVSQGDDASPMPAGTPKRPGVSPTLSGYVPAGSVANWSSNLPSLTFIANNAFPLVLDGRYLRAFNGPGMAGMGTDLANPFNSANFLPSQPMPLYANFRYNGNILNNVLTYLRNNNSYPNGFTPTLRPGYGDPNQISSMDEDYDAADLENWFLAVQSADGQVVLPSFHRPGVLTQADWTRQWSNNDTPDVQSQATRSMSKILRPRRADGHSPISFPDLLPDATTGKISFDVDNDGDGTTDAVWLDLGYPPKRNAEGQLFKPMFAFTVIGLNGKLPLNTAGNLQSRTPVGPAGNGVFQEFDHTEHYGNSPSEIDMRYALQNAYDPTPGRVYSQKDNAGIATPGLYNANAGVFIEGTLADGTTPGGIPVAQTQLRNILAGNRIPDPSGLGKNGDANWVVVDGKLVPLPNGVHDVADTPTNGVVERRTEAVAGRWGEPDGVPQQLVDPTTFNPPAYFYNNPVRAGHSIASGAFDARDDDFRTFDMWPSPILGESADFYDLQGALSLPVERMRRFVTPVDLSGDGRVVTFNGAASPRGPRANGADVFGRVSFFRYFRPPGLPRATVTIPTLNITAGDPVYPDLPGKDTNNPYHGYTSHMNPAPVVGIQNTLLAGAMPSDLDNDGTTVLPIYGGGKVSAALPQKPTYSVNVNSQLAFISPGLNDADETNLYTPSRLDAPFGPSDLEWLYRFQDVDGAALNSRLAQLAPISFLNPKDSARRRRLFALDAWETTNFVWAHDNPSGTFPNNSRFSQVGNASFAAVNQAYVNNVPTPKDPAWDFSVQAQVTNTGGTKYPVATPSIAHRDRRINLNFPLPVSNSPAEPVRQKWVRETYEFLKATLPPKAVDTPEELAQLSQYVVNIVDFRDPDATMTKFVNTDIVVVQATPGTANTSQGTQAQIQFASLANQPTIWPSYDPRYNENDKFLIQWGMEYQPVAINEVLATKFQTKITRADDNPVDTNYTTRFFVELVNTLTRDGMSQPPGSDSSDLDLAGWDFIVLPDANGIGRPDPYTGQVPTMPLTRGLQINAYPLSYAAPLKTVPPDSTSGQSTDAAVASIAGMTPRIQALATTPGNAADVNSYYVFGNAATRTADNSPELQGTQPVLSNAGNTALFDQLVTNELTKGTVGRDSYGNTTEGQYYWLYLRRPPNPFDTSYDPSRPNDNRVVVDSFRFLYTKEPRGKGFTDTQPNPNVDTNSGHTPTGSLFSLQRMQPFRGGHAVPPLPGDRITGAPPKFVLTSYGYSEQTSRPASGSGNFGNYGQNNGNTSATTRTTLEITHTLGRKNNPADTSWDYIPFNDRDFTSVAELLMVPGCPPGLFTKQFAEKAPPIVDSSTGVAGSTFRAFTGTPLDATANLWNGTPWAAAGSRPTQFAANTAPHSNPYLVDKFFYTAASEQAWPEDPSVNLLPTPRHYTSTDLTAPTNYVGGPSSAGWHKMLEFFEVPSTMFGAIGQVKDGMNYDWARQDLRPGLLNLNLIVDEEVFLGLMGESLYGNPYNPQSRGPLNQVQLGLGSAANIAPPLVVTQVNELGTPTASYPMPNLGCWDVFTDPITGGSFSGNNMKACFADFLKIRHGATGFMFGFGRDAVGSIGQTVGNTSLGLAPDRPFRSLSFPDIDYTVMRPATLPPSNLTNPVEAWVNGVPPAYVTPVGTPSGYAHDPGVKNPYLFTRANPVQPPPIPTRRLFQVGDWFGSQANQLPPSNAGASVFGSPTTGDPYVNTQTVDQNPNTTKLYNPKYDLIGPESPATSTNVWLGGTGNTDQRDHPFFRMEMMQKVLNLTTVRTHQYAVWVTVGFFEVISQGDPSLAGIDYTRAYDTLGLELGVLDGRNIRYRGFFLVDRTRAVGFNPSIPGDFRNMVVYRQQIE